MIVNTALKTVAGSAYGFARTCVKVYNATSPTKALIAGVKGIVIDCTIIKYPLLCLVVVPRVSQVILILL